MLGVLVNGAGQGGTEPGDMRAAVWIMDGIGIAEELGVSKGRISQLHAQALDKVRQLLLGRQGQVSGKL